MAKRITSAFGRFSNSTVTNGDEAFKNDNLADYTVKKKVEGNYATKRVLYWVGVFVALVLLIGLIAMIAPGLVAIFGFLIFLVTLIAVFFTWPYFNINYSYAIENSEFFATEIYGERADKLLVRMKMSQITYVAPYDGEYKKIADKEYAKKLVITSTMTPPNSDAYFLTYKTEDGKEGIVFFEACTKSLKAFKYYNSSNTVVRETSR